MQRAIKVNDIDSFNELNELLANEWEVVSMCGMPSSAAVNTYGSNAPTCLVILKK